jgi:hypothetical protein
LKFRARLFGEFIDQKPPQPGWKILSPPTYCGDKSMFEAHNGIRP